MCSLSLSQPFQLLSWWPQSLCCLLFFFFFHLLSNPLLIQDTKLNLKKPINFLHRLTKKQRIWVSSLTTCTLTWMEPTDGKISSNGSPSLRYSLTVWRLVCFFVSFFSFFLFFFFLQFSLGNLCACANHVSDFSHYLKVQGVS